MVVKEVKLMAIHKGKDPPVPRRLVGESQVPPTLSPAYPNAKMCQDLGWLVNVEKLELEPKQVSTL